LAHIPSTSSILSVLFWEKRGGGRGKEKGKGRERAERRRYRNFRMHVKPLISFFAILISPHLQLHTVSKRKKRKKREREGDEGAGRTG